MTRPSPEAEREAFGGALLPLLGALGVSAVQWARSEEPRQIVWLDGTQASSVGVAGCGWLLRLGDAHSTDALFLAAPARARGSEHRVLLASLLCRIAWQIRGPDAVMPADDNLDPATADAIHALRNGLNAAVMNVAVLAAHAAALPPQVQPMVQDAVQATDRSARELHRLVLLIQARG